MTTKEAVSRPALLILAATLMALAGACNSGGGAPSSGAVAPAEGPARLTLTVQPQGPDGRMTAAVKIDADAALSSGQLSFILPETCKIMAGAAMRSIKEVTPGVPIQQELVFECPTGVAGELTVSLSAKDASGKPVTSSASAKL